MWLTRSVTSGTWIGSRSQRGVGWAPLGPQCKNQTVSQSDTCVAVCVYAYMQDLYVAVLKYAAVKCAEGFAQK